jgi:hypothetical protein
MRIALCAMALFAQTGPMPADPLPAWLGVLIQGGCFGLICVIVLVRDPRMQAEAKAEREAVAERLRLTTAEMEARFSERNRELVNELKTAIGAACRNGR